MTDGFATMRGGALGREEILRRIRNPRLKGEINWLRSNFIHGIKQMPIQFDVV